MARDGIDTEIMKMLRQYTSNIEQDIVKAEKRIGRKAKDRIRRTAPRKTGRYAESWSIREFKKRGSFRLVVYSKDHYRLTHLLENGFRHKPDNNFIEGQEHIAPVQQEVDAEFEKAVEKIIKG